MSRDLLKVFKACGFGEVNEELARDVNKIVDWQVVLQSVNTNGVEPMYNTLGEVEYIYNHDDVLKKNENIFRNAPETEDNFFVVPKVVVK